MPIYEYECSSCRYYAELLQKVTDRALKKCPSCGKNTFKKLLSAPVFRLKGGGWYETDFKSDAERKRNLAAADKEEAGAAAKSEAPAAGKAEAAASASAGEAKTEAKGEPKPAATAAAAKPAAGERSGKRRAPAASGKPTRRRGRR